MNLSDDLKRILLAGIGAAATTAEKSKDLIDALVSKGELTIAQGKVLNEELTRKAPTAEKKPAAGFDIGSLESLTPEQRAVLKTKLEELDSKDV